MSKWVYVVAYLLWAILAAVFLAKLANAEELVGDFPFNTQPFPCDGIHRTYVWENAYPFAVRIKRLRIFHGRDYQVVADYHSEINRNDGARMAFFSQDAYSDATVRESDWTYSPDYYVLNPGDWMALTTICNQFAGPAGGRGHTIVKMDFTRAEQAQ